MGEASAIHVRPAERAHGTHGGDLCVFAAEFCGVCSSAAAFRHAEEAGWGPLVWEHKLHSFPTVYVCIHNKNDTGFIFDVRTQIEECYLSLEPKPF